MIFDDIFDDFEEDPESVSSIESWERMTLIRMTECEKREHLMDQTSPPL